jgi:hypothetical protein
MTQMSYINELRKMHKKLIDVNASIATVNRRKLEEVDGAIEEKWFAIGDIVCRVFVRGETNIPQIINSDIGTKQENTKFGAVFEWNADIKGSEKERDYITVDGATYEVMAITDLKYRGYTFGKIADLRRIE